MGVSELTSSMIRAFPCNGVCTELDGAVRFIAGLQTEVPEQPPGLELPGRPFSAIGLLLVNADRFF